MKGILAASLLLFVCGIAEKGHVSGGSPVLSLERERGFGVSDAAYTLSLNLLAGMYSTELRVRLM